MPGWKSSLSGSYNNGPGGFEILFVLFFFRFVISLSTSKFNSRHRPKAPWQLQRIIETDLLEYLKAHLQEQRRGNDSLNALNSTTDVHLRLTMPICAGLRSQCEDNLLLRSKLQGSYLNNMGLEELSEGDAECNDVLAFELATRT